MFKAIKNFLKGKKSKSISYAESISYMADNKTKFQVICSGSDHINTVMSNIFRTANYYVCIFANDLSGEISDETYLFWLKTFLDKKDTKLEIILGCDYNSKSIVIPYLLKQLRNNSKLRDGIKLSRAKEVIDGIEEHFVVADNRMYVKEISWNHVCTGNFNDEEKSLEFKKLFDSIETQELKFNMTAAEFYSQYIPKYEKDVVFTIKMASEIADLYIEHLVREEVLVKVKK